jgi:argininosuccinate synthase
LALNPIEGFETTSNIPNWYTNTGVNKESYKEKNKVSAKVNKVVLAYSGGLDTSVILKWLIETYGCDVVTFSADLGQMDPMGDVEKNAMKTGAVKAYVDDLKEDFVRDYVFPMFRANAIYEGQYLLGTSIARPLIAKRQMEIAAMENADAVSHGATGKGNDQVRFELSYLAIDPSIKIIAPWREWDLNSRTALMDFAARHGISVPTTHAKPYSTDGNMLHISYEGGILEDPWQAAPEDIFQMTVSPMEAPDEPESIEVTFAAGNPVALNGESLSPANMLAALNRLGGKHGIGRVDLVENRYVGMKSRGVYETPGGTILRQAHMGMESLTLDREVMQLRDSLVPKYAQLVYNGFWFAPERLLMQTMIDEAQRQVSGTVRLRLYKGGCMVTGRKSDVSLYSEAHATFEDDAVYSQKDAEGFIRLNALRLRIQKLMQNG